MVTVKPMGRDVRILGGLYGATKGGYAGTVFDARLLCPSINCMSGGGRQPHVVVKEKV